MKIFLKQLSLYLLLPLAIMLTIGLFDNSDKKYSPNENIIKLQNLNSFDSLDFLFVGNSYCYSGIKNSMFDSLNIRTFNLGIATAGPLFYKLTITDYLSSIKKYPNYTFLLVSPTSFSNGADNFSAYPIHRYLDKPVSNFSLATSQLKMIFLYPELVQKSFKKGVNNIISFNKTAPVNNINPLLASKGYESSKIIIDKKIVKETEGLYMPFKKETFSNSRYSILLDIIAILQEKGIKVILFDLPTNKLSKYYNAEFNKTYNDVIADLKKNIILFP
ncbi:MAG: hypothetical protein IPL54_01385 [Chitinophagaceae bacterium]|nr:hypothetical protein [Chitinophagaceae bacterium]